MRWTLRAKILTYIVLLHVILAAMSVVVLLQRPVLLLAFEALFVCSAVVGYLLVRAFFVPLDLIRTGADLMRERDFATRFRDVGQSEMDELVRVYNRMVDRLREERLHLEERNLFVDKVVRASPTGIVILDHDGRIVDVNRSAEGILGADAVELLGRFPFEPERPLLRSLTELRPDESRVVSAGGRRLKCRRAEFFDRGATRTFYLIDELTEELRASESAAYGKLIRMMSHEVQNSVGAVRSLLESCATYAAQLREADRPDYEQALSVASSRLLHLSRFMSDLATVVRVPEPERRPCDLLALVRDVELLLRPELERRRIRVRWETAEPLADVPLDRHQIEQVLVNVMRNAIEAVDQGGEIVLASGRDRRSRWLAVRDSGPGIDASQRAALFTPFHSTKRDGQGVGLTLSREILTRHGFEFSLDNRPEGGAEFRVQL